MDQLVIEVLKSIATQGPLVAFLFYLHIQNEKKLDKKDEEIKTLNKCILDMHKEAITVMKDCAAQSGRLADALEDLPGKKDG